MTKRRKSAKPNTPDRAGAEAQVADRAACDVSPADAGHGAVGPPGRVTTDPEAAATGNRCGSARLRHLLELSAGCDIEQVCDDAAREIERLRAETDKGRESRWW